MGMGCIPCHDWTISQEQLQNLVPQAWDHLCQVLDRYGISLREVALAKSQEEAVSESAEACEAIDKLVCHLTERLSGSDDGKPKVFRDSAVDNLREFFSKFKHLNVRSSEQLDQLVQQAQQIVAGVQPQQLRDSSSLRQQVATQLSGVQSVLDGMLVDRPRRNILRRPK